MFGVMIFTVKEFENENILSQFFRIITYCGQRGDRVSKNGKRYHIYSSNHLKTLFSWTNEKYGTCSELVVFSCTWLYVVATQLTYHLCLVRLASKETFTALSQITLYARQTVSSSRSTEPPTLGVWHRTLSAWMFPNPDARAQRPGIHRTCLLWVTSFLNSPLSKNLNDLPKKKATAQISLFILSCPFVLSIRYHKRSNTQYQLSRGEIWVANFTHPCEWCKPG